MTKVSKRLRAHKNTKSQPIEESRNFFQLVNTANAEEHPVDLEVERRLKSTAVRRRLRGLSDKITGALGTKSPLFFDFDALFGSFEQERAEVHFNVGYEYGILEGLVRARRALGNRALSKVAQDLGTETRHRLLQAKLPVSESILALVESLWAITAGTTALGSEVAS